MYIRQTTHKNKLNGKSYATYKLIHGYRNAQGKVRQETLLNLGSSFTVPESQWKLLADKIEQLVSGKNGLFEIELPKTLESKARSLSKQVIKKRQILEAEGLKRKEASELRKASGIEPNYQTVDIDSTEDSDVRFIGAEYLGIRAARQLELELVLKDLGFNEKQSKIATASIISRLVCPSSELRTHRYLTSESALDELLETEFANLQLQQLYLASDRLHDNKEAIENALYKRERELFELSEVITLFDITNTYFEGHPEHSGAKRGRSKEKRSDCELVSLGILLDGSGFPKKTKMLPGNISEPSTLKDMLLGMETKATVIMDAGIASKDNIEYLKANGYKYIVVKRDSNLTMPDEVEPIVVKEALHNKVSVSLVKSNENAEEVELYCHSSAKEEQNKLFVDKMSQRLEEELTKLNTGLQCCDLSTDISDIRNNATAIILNNGDVYVNSSNALEIKVIIKSNLNSIDEINTAGNIVSNIVTMFIKQDHLSTILKGNREVLGLVQKYTGQVRSKSKVQNKLIQLFAGFVVEGKRKTTKDYTKIVEKIGRLKEHYKSVAYMYDIGVIPDIKRQNAISIEYKQKTDKLENKQSGIYCLTSNRTDLDADTLWNTYTMLTDLESAFRSLKSELGMRPVYHQLEHRIDGHIFISILAYHLLHTIRYQLKQNGIHHSWDKIRNIMSTQVRVTTSQELKEGGAIKLRKTSRATVEQMEIYNALGISSPGKLETSYF